MKNLLVLLLALAAPVFSKAQPGGGNWGGDPAQRAEKQTEMMAEKCALSEAQTAKVREVNLRFAQKMKDFRAANPDADRDAMRAQMQTLRAEQDAELKVFLTDEQWELWQKARAEQRSQRGGGEKQGSGSQ